MSGQLWDDAPLLLMGDTIELMGTLPSGSVDAIICDLPYGTTDCRWDAIIPFDQLWAQYERVIKANGSVVLFGAQPFTSALVMSKRELFKYQWAWDKQAVTGFANAKKQPLRHLEDVLVFYKSQPTYNPQGLIYSPKIKRNGKSVGGDTIRGNVENSANRGKLRTGGSEYVQEFTNYPKQLLSFGRDGDKSHPTQKPVALCEYLIRTHTDAGDVVLDNCMGSGTTGVAAMLAGRKFIGIERDPEYFQISVNRIMGNGNT
jgi:site-specific DNA-methyltransferase (adenine-specific)